MSSSGDASSSAERPQERRLLAWLKAVEQIFFISRQTSFHGQCNSVLLMEFSLVLESLNCAE